MLKRIEALRYESMGAADTEHLGELVAPALADGDILLLCSDGLTGMVEDGKIAEVLAGAGTLEDKGRELLTLALEGGGRDNITVALFTCGAKQEA